MFAGDAPAVFKRLHLSWKLLWRKARSHQLTVTPKDPQKPPINPKTGTIQ